MLIIVNIILIIIIINTYYLDRLILLEDERLELVESGLGLG